LPTKEVKLFNALAIKYQGMLMHHTHVFIAGIGGKISVRPSSLISAGIAPESPNSSNKKTGHKTRLHTLSNIGMQLTP
jgi:hypothetical protein